MAGYKVAEGGVHHRKGLGPLAVDMTAAAYRLDKQAGVYTVAAEAERHMLAGEMPHTVVEVGIPAAAQVYILVEVMPHTAVEAHILAEVMPRTAVELLLHTLYIRMVPPGP